MAKRRTVLSTLIELVEESIKQNYNERISTQEREIQLLKGNLNEANKKVRALERFLKVEYIQTNEYKKLK